MSWKRSVWFHSFSKLSSQCLFILIHFNYHFWLDRIINIVVVVDSIPLFSSNNDSGIHQWRWLDIIVRFFFFVFFVFTFDSTNVSLSFFSYSFNRKKTVLSLSVINDSFAFEKEGSKWGEGGGQQFFEGQTS